MVSLEKPSTPRRPLDFYPTPRDVVFALLAALEGLVNFEREQVLDPMAGDGDLLLHLGAAKSHAIEINPLRLGALELVAPRRVVIADALSVEWPDACVVANPAFALLDAVWQRCVDHRASRRRLCAVLMPVAWWSAEKRAGYEEPDIIIQLGWRPTFHRKDGPAHKGSQDFVWSVLLPEPQGAISWMRIPKALAVRERLEVPRG